MAMKIVGASKKTPPPSAGKKKVKQGKVKMPLQPVDSPDDEMLANDSLSATGIVPPPAVNGKPPEAPPTVALEPGKPSVNGHHAQPKPDIRLGDVALAMADGVAPGPLPVDTETYALEQFIPRVFKHDRRTQMASVMVLALLVAGYFIPMQFSAYVTIGIAFAVPFVLILVFVLLVKSSTRLVEVIRTDVSGVVVLDDQKWWRGDERGWPAAWQKRYNGKRTLWIDATAYDPAQPQDTLKMFNPWLQPLPTRPEGVASIVRIDTPSQAQLGKAWAQARAARSMLDTRSTTSTIIQQGLLIAGIAIALGLTYMAGSRLNGLRDEKTVAEIEASLSEKIRQQVINELTRPTPVQPFEPSPR